MAETKADPLAGSFTELREALTEYGGHLLAVEKIMAEHAQREYQLLAALDKNIDALAEALGVSLGGSGVTSDATSTEGDHE